MSLRGELWSDSGTIRRSNLRWSQTKRRDCFVESNSLWSFDSSRNDIGLDIRLLNRCEIHNIIQLREHYIPAKFFFYYSFQDGTGAILAMREENAFRRLGNLL